VRGCLWVLLVGWAVLILVGWAVWKLLEMAAGAP
jgi:hypothetical protein